VDLADRSQHSFFYQLLYRTVINRRARTVRLKRYHDWDRPGNLFSWFFLWISDHSFRERLHETGPMQQVVLSTSFPSTIVEDVSCFGHWEDTCGFSASTVLAQDFERLKIYEDKTASRDNGTTFLNFPQYTLTERPVDLGGSCRQINTVVIRAFGTVIRRCTTVWSANFTIRVTKTTEESSRCVGLEEKRPQDTAGRRYQYLLYLHFRRRRLASPKV
jgi:hypothetical protein